MPAEAANATAPLIDWGGCRARDRSWGGVAPVAPQVGGGCCWFGGEAMRRPGGATDGPAVGCAAAVQPWGHRHGRGRGARCQLRDPRAQRLFVEAADAKVR